MKKLIIFLLAIAISCTAAACGTAEEEAAPAASAAGEDVRQTVEALEQ
jgi:predicted small secreted protein